MRLLPFGLLSIALTASPQTAPETKRIDYPQEKFSIAIPSSWTEIDLSVLATIPLSIRQILPNAPPIKIRYGFKSSSGPGLPYPWIAIIITDDPLNESMFENLEPAYRTIDELSRKLESGGTLQRAQMSDMWYDKSRHILWMIAQSTLAGVGDLRTLSGAHLTATGTVQVHCYSRATDVPKDLPVCKEAIESVLVDPKIGYVSRPTKPVALADLTAADYRTLVERVEGGDFTVDFRALRLACMRSTECDPRGQLADLEAVTRASAGHQSAQALETAERLIRQGFVSFDAHMYCIKAYGELHEPAKAKFHMDVTKSLVRSILLYGDGKTKETAFEVISDREEYVTLAAMGLPFNGTGVSARSDIQEDGRRYDRWEVPDPKTGQKTVVFFNIDAFTSKSRLHRN
jgi:hypothetical protein